MSPYVLAMAAAIQSQRELLRSQLATVSMAADLAGRSRSWIRSRVADGRLKIARVDGRDLVELRSLYNLLAIDVPTLDEQIEDAEGRAARGERGAAAEAYELRDERRAMERAAGCPFYDDMPTRSADPPATTRATDPASEFLRKLSGL